MSDEFTTLEETLAHSTVPLFPMGTITLAGHSHADDYPKSTLPVNQEHIGNTESHSYCVIA